MKSASNRPSGRMASSCRGFAVIGTAVLMACAAPLACAAPAPLGDPAHWATITHAGNAPYTYTQGPNSYTVGQVNHEYRISKTETTQGEWFEFIQAYKPFVDPSYALSLEFIGTETALAPNGTGYDYHLNPGSENYAPKMGWRFAARYVNWLHNGKVNQAWAFEGGVYDTSTFGDNKDGSFSDQFEHAPDAKFWIPSLDEWTKAAYYDPVKGGAGVPGYWRYPITSDSAPVPGLPGQGQTNGAELPDGTRFPEQPVGAYSTVVSPWGLWDMSGSQSEFTGSRVVDQGNGETYRVFIRGSSTIQHQIAQADDIHGSIDYVAAPNWQGLTGLRLASAVPAPSVIALVGVAGALCVKRRRSRCNSEVESCASSPSSPGFSHRKASQR